MDWLWELDRSLFRTIHLGWHQDWLDPVFWVVSSTGLGYVQALVVLGMLTHRRAKEAVPALLTTLAIAAVVSPLAKKVMPRMRPSSLLESVPQEGFFYNSYPSGHTLGSFALATMISFLALRAGRPLVCLVAMLWAFAVGLSRVYRGLHWPTDVIGGAALGMACACAAYVLLSHLKRGLPEPSATNPEPLPER